MLDLFMFWGHHWMEPVVAPIKKQRDQNWKQTEMPEQLGCAPASGECSVPVQPGRPPAPSGSEL